MIHRDLLRYNRARYLWWSLTLVALSIAVYASQSAARPHNGGSWQGYVLGSIGVLLIVWLTALGIRKRSYGSNLGSVQGWTSAHIYLGTALIVVATLHCGFEFGWNVHTLAYALMCIVVISGLFGLYTYLSRPAAIARNREGATRAALFAELFELDQSVRQRAAKCDPAIALAVSSGTERAVLGGGALSQLFARDRSWFVRADESGTGSTLTSNRDQQPMIDFVAARLPRAGKSSEAAMLQELVVLLCRRQAVVRRIRRDIALQGSLKIWLYVHVPLTAALLGALVLHIVSTFAYW
jgi:hypothetical protein